MKPRDQKRQEELERQAYRDERRTFEQMVRLDARLGVNQGAKRERAKLQAAAMALGGAK